MSLVAISLVLARLRSRRDGSRDRGAVMVEFVLAVPLVILFAFAIIEFSLIWRNSLTVTTASQLGARAAANAGPERLADYRALSSALSGLSELPPDAVIERVVVFKPIDDQGTMDPDCRTATTGKTGLCNVYVGSNLNNPSSTIFGVPGETCDSGDPDVFWCPTSRKNDFGTGFDRVGVFVAVRHQHVTGVLFGDTTRTLTQTTVMQLEPEVTQ